MNKLWDDKCEFVPGIKRTLERMPIREIHKLADQFFVDCNKFCTKHGNPFSCGGLGCGHCCTGEIAITVDEAKLILEHASNTAFIRAWKNRTIFNLDPEDILYRQTPCPLLDPETMTCEVYDIRPTTCRTYHVVSPREWCNWKHEIRDVSSFMNLLAFGGAVLYSRNPTVDDDLFLNVGKLLAGSAPMECRTL